MSMSKKISFAAGIILGAIIIVALAVVFTPTISEQQAFNKTIEVNGNAVVKVTPDEAHIMVAVVSEAVTAKDAAAMNAENMTSVFNELNKAGITDVKTRQFSLTPIYKWIEEETLRGKEQKSVIVGYRATNLIEVVAAPEEAGKSIDAAIKGGANRIDSISFALSETLQEEVYSDALRKAVRDGQNKADVVARELGIVKYYPVTISVMDYPIISISAPRAVPAVSEEVPTPITPSEVEITANVRIVYAF